MKPIGLCPDCKGKIKDTYAHELTKFAICVNCERQHPIERFWDTFVTSKNVHWMRGLRCKKCKSYSIVEGDLTGEKICLYCRDENCHERIPETFKNKPTDKTNPSHYELPKGLQVIDLIRDETFPVGNALKYILRRKDKNDEIGDLRKAIWYLYEELERLGEGRNPLKKN